MPIQTEPTQDNFVPPSNCTNVRWLGLYLDVLANRAHEGQRPSETRESYLFRLGEFGRIARRVRALSPERTR